VVVAAWVDGGVAWKVDDGVDAAWDEVLVAWDEEVVVDSEAAAWGGVEVVEPSWVEVMPSVKVSESGPYQKMVHPLQHRATQIQDQVHSYYICFTGFKKKIGLQPNDKLRKTQHHTQKPASIAQMGLFP